jgi:hypothetical protein
MSGQASDRRWPPDRVVEEVRRRIEALSEELRTRLTDSLDEVNALLAEHAWRHERVVSEVLAEAGWAEEDYWVALAEHLEQDP